jgi:hypothetical protein
VLAQAASPPSSIAYKVPSSHTFAGTVLQPTRGPDDVEAASPQIVAGGLDLARFGAPIAAVGVAVVAGLPGIEPAVAADHGSGTALAAARSLASVRCRAVLVAGRNGSARREGKAEKRPKRGAHHRPITAGSRSGPS